MFIEHFLDSRCVGERRMRLLPPAVDVESSDLLILLDGEIYADRLPTCEVVEAGQRDGSLRPFWTVFVDQVDLLTRWRDTMCSDQFANFLADELVPWVQSNVAETTNGRVAIGGLSLSGLQAAFSAVRRPETFSSGFCQSPSFWWEEARLAVLCGDLSPHALAGVSLRVSCGHDETAENVDHGFGLIQRMSQLEGCRVVCEALRRSGASIDDDEIPGGHDLETWTRDLPECLAFVFGEGSR